MAIEDMMMSETTVDDPKDDVDVVEDDLPVPGDDDNDGDDDGEVTDDDTDQPDAEESTATKPQPGIIHDLQKTRVRAQTAEEQVSALESRNRQMEMELARINGRLDASQTPGPIGDPDPLDALKGKEDYEVSPAEMIAAIQEHDQWVARRNKVQGWKDQQNQQQALLVDAEESGQEEFTTDRCGESRDFESVTTSGMRYLTQHDRDAILAKRTPRAIARETYRRCLMCNPTFDPFGQSQAASEPTTSIRPTTKPVSRTTRPANNNTATRGMIEALFEDD